jgi:tetratricopeptide (TPR) repeat protein
MASDANQNVRSPQLDELLARFLHRHAEARAAGLAEVAVGEVEPYEAAFAPVIEPRVAWDEALSALTLLDAEHGKLSFTPPADWSALMSATESIPALAYAAGNFPQLLRDLLALIRSPRRSNQPIAAASAVSIPSLTAWTTDGVSKARFPQAFLGIGALRLAGQFDAAARILEQLRGSVPERWRIAFMNEEAALAWHGGHLDQAAKLWNEMPESAPVWFNRGMAALFLDRLVEARAALAKAVALLPEDGAWHHLARLYLALSEI